MPRHVLHPLPRAFAGHRDPTRRETLLDEESVWSRLDRVQVLGDDTMGHTGCVNALAWSDDGSILLSGSDDQRICMWKADPSSSTSPHPLVLSDVIATGHRANIFSARFLPNASTPTIVSCAGDREIRVFEVEKLGRAERSVFNRGRDELYGGSGPGTRVLKCHRDRTKRIATENSPHLFLTVSEDGTVRQHDLRRPHQCQVDCPEPLFHAPRGVDLYSLSVSTVTPHIFAVAGRTDSAFVCDRRMLDRQQPSWGPNVKSAGHVHCVRRLGLREEQWHEVMPHSQRRLYGDERHITCVKMSPDKGDEVICSFARHSTALFSIFDSPGPSSMHTSLSPVLAPNSDPPQSPSRFLRSPKTTAAPHRENGSPLGKRRISQLSTADPAGAQRARGENPLPDDPQPGSDEPSPISTRARTPDWARGMEYEQYVEAVDAMEDSGFGDSTLGVHISGWDTPPEGDTGGNIGEVRMADYGFRQMGGRIETPSPIREQREQELLEESDPDGLLDAMEGSGLMQDIQSMAADIEAEDDDISEEESDEDPEDGSDGDMYDELIAAEQERIDSARHAAKGEFDPVDLLYPRRCFKGARNVETVKDCNFFGARSDKVCSGSDDGNFFVWDKESGRLEGIWEGDGSVVNVMEQHPTLPLVAVSGIDSSVKMFAPITPRPDPSFARIQMRDTIVQANMDHRDRFDHSLSFGSGALLQLLASRGLVRIRSSDDGDEEQSVQDCQTQ